jgi:membrane associated rhomboid family serine protease
VSTAPGEPPSARDSFPLRGRSRAIVLDDAGLHHPGGGRGLRSVFTPYSEITHLSGSARTLWIGARRSVYVLPRRAFGDPRDADRLVRALLERVARGPDGARQLARMAEIEEFARSAPPLRATWALVAACLAVFVLQLALGPEVAEVGYFSPLLVADGDLWRIATANLLHGAPEVPVHLLLNLLGLIVVGTLVERPLGAARTLVVMGASGIGAMGASALAGYSQVVGVSGVVFGLAGGLTWLELRRADHLPAAWRLPRRVLWTLLAVNAALMWLVPIIAGAAHAGGFAAGALAAALSTRVDLELRRPAAWVRAGALAAVVLTLLSLASAARELAAHPDFIASHSRRLAALPGVPPEELNDRAWIIAVSDDATRGQLDAALELATRAVAETGREEATILDTLAEVQFQLGRRDEAIATIDEAIARAPAQPYYREQRRRFTGERAADDRPDLVPVWREGDPAPAPSDGGLSV